MFHIHKYHNYMKQLLTYHAPQAFWSELAAGSLICDSYNSGIDDYDYVDVNMDN